ncbi:MAG: Tim44-like domain-containing protein [Rhodocyclaceae bacterium]|nr:Tim44-like domain-containing protein [Rhodocyclaceae bacterium]
MRNFLFSLMTIAVAMGMTLLSPEAEAKRLGGNKSIGMQRQMTPPAQPAPPPAAAPAPVTAKATPAPAPAPAAAAQASSGARSWLGPLAGLAAGIGLAALAAHFGFGEELAALMLMLLIAFAVLAVIGFVMRRRLTARQPALAGATSIGYVAHEPVLGTASRETGARQEFGHLPAAFDVEGFLRSAKVNFLRLQAANDEGRLDDLRDFTTPEMFAALKEDLAGRQGAQRTDVVRLDAQVLDLSEEDERYVASVRFTGVVREDAEGPLTDFDEVWHLIKPRDGSSGWKLAGIQQMH